MPCVWAGHAMPAQLQLHVMCMLPRVEGGCPPTGQSAVGWRSARHSLYSTKPLIVLGGGELCRAPQAPKPELPTPCSAPALALP